MLPYWIALVLTLTAAAASAADPCRDPQTQAEMTRCAGEDYARAGMRMLPVVDPAGERTRLTMLLYTAGLGIASLLPFVVRMAGEVYLGTAICLDALFFAPAVTAAFTRWESAMRMTFLVSIVYLPLLLLVMVLDRQDPLFPV